MRSSRARRLVMGCAAALQAAVHAAVAAPLLAAESPVGTILAVFFLAGLLATVRLLAAECVECRAVVITLGVLTLLGILLAITVGYPGQSSQPLSLVGAISGLASVVAGAAMLAPRPASDVGSREFPAYHR